MAHSVKGTVDPLLIDTPLLRRQSLLDRLRLPLRLRLLGKDRGFIPGRKQVPWPAASVEITDPQGLWLVASPS